MPGTSKLKIKRDIQIYNDFKKLFFDKKLQHEACMQKLSEKYFLEPGTIVKIVQKQRGEAKQLPLINNLIIDKV